MKRFKKLITHPFTILILLIMGVYWQFFVLGKIPLPADTLVGAYFPWLDYKWGYPAGVPVKNALISDAFSQFIQWRYLGIDLMLQGQWPLWNPYSFSGVPLLATYQTAPFLPFNLLLLLPKYSGWGFYIFGQTLFAAAGMYFLLSRYTQNPHAKIAGALVFAFSGLMTTWVEFMSGVYAAGGLAFALGSVKAYFDTGKIRYLFLMTGSFSVTYLAGASQITVYSTGLFFVFLLFQFFQTTKKDWRQILLPVLYWVLALGICAIQFIPTIVHVGKSVRGDEAYSKSINFGLNKGYEVVRLFSADFFGNPVTNNHWDTIYYHEQSSFLGTLILVLIAPLLLKRFRTRDSMFWFGVFIASVFLAIEHPVTKFLYSQPLPLLTYSSASRIFFITSLSAAVLTGLAVTKLNEEKFRVSATKSAVILLSVIAGILLGMLFVLFILRFSIPGKETSELIINFKVTFKNILIPIALLITFYIFVRFKIKFFVVLTVLLIFFDLSRYFLKHNPFVPQSLIFPETPVISFLQNQSSPYRIARADYEAFPPNTWVPYKIESIEGYDPLAFESYGRYFNKVNNRGYNSGIDRFMELRNYPNKFIDSLNVKFLIAVKRDDKGVIPGDKYSYRIDESGYKPVFEDKNTAVLENQNAKDRVYPLENIISVSSVGELAKTLDDKSFDPTKTGVVINRKELENSYVKVTVSDLNVLPQKTLFNTQSESGGFLLVANSFDDGWHLTMDGKPAELVKINGALQGVITPGGEHQFEINYYPKEFDLGLKITLISCLVFLLSIFYTHKTKLF